MTSKLNRAYGPFTLAIFSGDFSASSLHGRFEIAAQIAVREVKAESNKKLYRFVPESP